MKHLLLTNILLIAAFAQAQDLYFPPAQDDGWETTAMADIGWCEDRLPAVNDFMTSSDSRSLMILKGGKIVVEEYYNGHSRDSLWYWASAGKTLTAMEIGILQSEGALDITDSTSDYLGSGWTSCTPEQEAAIQIRHQLTMSTGLDYTVQSSDCTDPDCLLYLGDPNSEWFYHNAPYTLLSDVIEEASGLGRNVHTFLSVGQKTGILGGWLSIDENIVFVSKTTTMARFGLLMLAEGEWSGETILADKDYYQQMISPSQDLNPSYGYLWWLNTGPTYRLPTTTIDFSGRLLSNAPAEVYMALGKNGQIIVVDPTSDLVVVRMGDSPDQSLVPTAFVQELWDQVQSLSCTTSTDPLSESDIKILPNPTSDVLTIHTEDQVSLAKVYSISNGQLMTTANSKYIDTTSLPAGLYIISITTARGTYTKRFVKS